MSATSGDDLITDSKTRDGVLVLRLGKRLTIAAAPELRDALTEQVKAADGPRLVVLDLSQTDSLDSGALGVLIQFHRDLDRKEVPLVLAAPNESVRGLVEIMKLDSIFDIHEDVDAAIEGSAP